MREADRMAAEQRYVAGTMTLRALAEETGISAVTLGKWCKAGGWVKKREDVQKRALKMAATKAVSKRARELAKLLEASGMIEDALIKASAQLSEALEDGNPALVSDSKYRASNIKSITDAVARALETRMQLAGILSKADEERMRIDKKRLKLQEQAARSANEGAEIVVQMDAETAEAAK